MKFTRTCLVKTLLCIAFLWVGCFPAVVSAQNLQSDPPSLTFAADPGHTAPLAAITITSTGAPLSGLTFTIDKPAGSPNWLFLNPSSAASTPATILAIAYAYTLQDGVYRATINVSATGPPSRTLSIPVTFVVGSGGGGQNATLTAAPASLSFSGQAGATSPASQQINITSTPDATPFSVSTSTTDGRSWLGALPVNATAPATVTVSVNTTGLPAGSYSGTVTLTPTGGSAVQVPVTLSVASASGLAVTPASLDFSYTIGGAGPSAKTFQVTSTGSSPVSFTTTATMTDGSGWLSSTPASGTTPQAVTVTINSAALTTAGVYRGKVRVAPPGGNASASVDVPVTVTVTGSGGGGGGGGGTAVLQVAPTSISFAGQVGGGSPAAQSVTVGSNPSGASVTVSAATASGGNWLQVSPSSGTTALNLTVSANTSGLSGGVYSGTITITPASGTAVTIPVSLALTSGPPLAVGATNLQFYYTIGAKPPAAQPLAITGLPVAFKATSSTTDGTAWLTLSNTDGTIPGSVAVAVNPVGYTAGVYQGKVTVSAPSANISIDVPVTLYVSVGPMLIVRNQSASFSFQPGGSNPDPQVISLDSSAQTLSYSTNVATSDGGKWLTVSPAFGTTPQNVTLTVNPEGLKPGTYSATIAISSPGATNTPVTVAVALTVKSSVIVPSIPTVGFNYQIGGTNQVVSQPLTVFSSGGDTTNGTATPAAANCPSGWLSVSPRTFATPATLTVTFDPSGIQGTQSCAGVIVLNANGVSNVVSVGANVATTRMVNVTPLSVRLYAPSQSSQPATQNIEVSTTDGVAMPFTASASTSDGQPWLTLTRTDSGAKSVLTVAATAASMGVGVYSGSVKITSPSAPQGLVVPVDLVVTPATIASADAASLVFTHTVRGTVPPAQTLGILTTSGSFGYKASVVPGMPASDYITISPAAGSTPGSLSVGVLSNSLAAGSYDGAVSILIPSADTKPLIVPVRIIVSAVSGGQAGGGVSADKSNLSFSVLQGATTAPSQPVSVTATGGTFNMSASVSPNTKWLSVTPDLGTAPGVFTVSANPTGLTAGRYNGTITLTSAGVPGSPITVNVQLDVTLIPVATPQIAAVTNAASLLQSAIAPGELVAITGSALGPATPVQPGLTAAGTLDTTAGGTQVLFDDIPAPLMYVSADQINVIVPYEIAGRNTVRIRVVNDQRGSSDPVTKQVGVAAPGIFTIASNGRGQGAILNANNTPNGMNVPARTPANRGSVVQIFGTGEGLLDPAAPSGSISKDIRIPLAPVTAMVGGIPAQVDFAGAAPGAPGVFQINVRIPKDALTGEVPITINIGGVNSQPGVTVAISWL